MILRVFDKMPFQAAIAGLDPAHAIVQEVHFACKLISSFFICVSYGKQSCSKQIISAGYICSSVEQGGVLCFQQPDTSGSYYAIGVCTILVLLRLLTSCITTI